jgi:hypothetical protein
MSLISRSPTVKLHELYKKNCEKKWHEWLSIKTIFKKTSKQGVLGILSVNEDSSLNYVFKFSQGINYLINHESNVMDSIDNISEYCPNFCRNIGIIYCDIDNTDENPFNIDSKYSIEKEILLMEYIDNSYKYYNYIVSPDVNEKIIFSILKQTLLAVSLAQKKKNFTHYDLHSNNIMIKKCSKNLVVLYVLDDDIKYAIPTFGYYPIIIDFGYSYTKDLEKKYLYSSMNYTELGFTSHRFDPIADTKIFLVTVSEEINSKFNSKNSNKLLNITKNIFYKIPLDWSSGWDQHSKKSANDYLINLISGYFKSSNLFTQYYYECMDLILSLIELPLVSKDYSDIHISFSIFLKEFVKIENEISNPYYCLYILKCIIDTARQVQKDYKNKESRDTCVKYFKNSICEKIDSIVKFCVLKDLHFEKLVCGLYCFVKNAEGVLYDSMTYNSNKKNNIYSKVRLNNIDEIFSVINININDEYTFNRDTKILCINAKNETCSSHTLDESQINHINSFKNYCWGFELCKLLNIG